MRASMKTCGRMLAQNERFAQAKLLRRRRRGRRAAPCASSAARAAPSPRTRRRPCASSALSRKLLPTTACFAPFRLCPSSPPAQNATRAREAILMIQSTALPTRMEQVHTQKAVLGVSGGLDSTLTLLAAAYAFRRAGYPMEGSVGHHHARHGHRQPHAAKRAQADAAHRLHDEKPSPSARPSPSISTISAKIPKSTISPMKTLRLASARRSSWTWRTKSAASPSAPAP